MSLADLLDLRDTAWMAGALCAQTDPEAFFPEKGGDNRRAKAVCSFCPVLADCREWAIPQEDLHGICGGMSVTERRRERQRRGLVPKGPQHGTRHCYSLGCRRPECIQANRDYDAAWRARRAS